MKKTASVLKSIAEGMKIMADGMNTVAEQLRRLADAQQTSLEVPEEKISEKMLPPGKTAIPPMPAQQISSPAMQPSYVTDASGKVVTKLKKAGARDKKNRPATDIVLNVIRNSDGGTDNQTISQKTGYDKKKVSNILFRLKKDGKIAPVSRGIYKST